MNLAPLAPPVAAAAAAAADEETTAPPPQAKGDGNGAPASGNGDGSGASGEGNGDEDWETVDISDTTAPSIGPHTTMKKPSQGSQGHEEHELDAMGLDKRRSVVGGRYSPPVAKQLTVYGVALAVIAALVIGAIVLVGELDQPPAQYQDKAPWTGSTEPPAQPQ